MTKEMIQRPRASARRLLSKLTALVTACALTSASLPVHAQQSKGPPVLRDTETEQLLRDYTRPILRTAGLEKQNIQMVIINDKSFNAFVADGRRIFVNYGAIMQSTTPNQLIGVLAHETGHLAGGHLSKFREQLARTQTQLIIAMLLGVGALAAGAAGSGGSNGAASNIGAAAISAPQEIARRSLLSYQRQQEENADRAGVKFLNATGQSAKGMYETFKRFTDESLFAARGADPYVQSHPMPVDRVAALAELARTSPYWDKKDDPALQMRHDMVRAKISAFMERQDTVYRRYPMSDTSLPARYAHAISTYLHGDLALGARANRRADQAPAAKSLFPRSAGTGAARGRPSRGGDCPAAAGRTSCPITPRSSRCYLGRRSWHRIIRPTPTKPLQFCARRWHENPKPRLVICSLRWLTAARAIMRRPIWHRRRPRIMRGDNKTARELASRAKTRFAIGTPGWVKADDIVSAKVPDKKD